MKLMFCVNIVRILVVHLGCVARLRVRVCICVCVCVCERERERKSVRGVSLSIKEIQGSFANI